MEDKMSSQKPVWVMRPLPFTPKGQRYRTYQMRVDGIGPSKHPVALYRANRWAVASILAAFSVVFLWWTLLPGPAAIVLGHIALRKMRGRPHRERGLAVSAITFGWLQVIVGLLIFGLASASFLSGPHGVG